MGPVEGQSKGLSSAARFESSHETSGSERGANAEEQEEMSNRSSEKDLSCRQVKRGFGLLHDDEASTNDTTIASIEAHLKKCSPCAFEYRLFALQHRSGRVWFERHQCGG